jgi:hypothetical protein
MAQVMSAAMVAVQVQHLRMMTTLTFTCSQQLLVFSTTIARRWMAQVTSAVMVADRWWQYVMVMDSSIVLLQLQLPAVGRPR